MEETEVLNQELREDIVNIVQSILNETHTVVEKRNINSYKKNQLEFACPVCGDSSKNHSKKRGILYLDSFKYYCWNGECSAKYWSIFKLFRRFGKNISNLEHIKQISESVKKSLETRKPTKLINSSEYFEFIYNNSISIKDLKTFYGLLDSKECSWGNKFIQERLVKKYSDIFLFRKNAFGNREVWILNKIDECQTIVGAQIKNLDYSVKYITKSFDVLHEEMKTELEYPATDFKEKCVNFSTIFNIFNIDIESTINIFEGPIDALFMKNSIATAGASKLKNFFDDLDNIRFFFDNDKTGKINSIEKIKKNNSCFLWKKFFKDNNIDNKRLKDLNELIQYINKNRGYLTSLNNINKCFSKSKYDIYNV